jgi:hypothetical protein
MWIAKDSRSNSASRIREEVQKRARIVPIELIDWSRLNGSRRAF